MTTSGSINFLVSRDDIITEALEILGVLGEGQLPNEDQLSSASRTLNMMVKNWQADGLNLFSVRRQYLFLEKGRDEYLLGSTTEDKFTESFQETVISLPASELDTEIEVEDASNILDGDTIGIATGTDVQWTTVSGSPVGSVVTLLDPLENDVSGGSVVYTYTQTATRPMKIMEGYVHLHSSGTDMPIGNISRRKYNSLSDKDSQGIVNQFYYDPQINTGSLFVWPTTNSEKDYLILFVQRTLEDLDTGTDSPDYPQEWYMPLAFGLALHSAPKFGIPSNDYSVVERQAVMLYERAKGFDEETYTSTYLTIDYRGEDL